MDVLLGGCRRRAASWELPPLPTRDRAASTQRLSSGSRMDRHPAQKNNADFNWA